MSVTSSVTKLRFAAALSTNADTAQAVDEVCQQALDQLAAPPHLAVVFLSPQHAESSPQLAQTLCDRLGTEALIGCTGESIVGGSREIEGSPAISLWLAHWPGVTVAPMHLNFERTPEGGTFTGWPDDLPEPWPEGAALLLLGDPFSFPADELIRRLNEDRPGVPVLGGMASGGFQPGETRLFLGRDELKDGAVAALVHGPIKIRSVVSQGCRPIGRHFVVTKAEANVLRELGGEPPMKRLQEVFETLESRDKELVRQGLHVGRAVSEYRDRFDRGDFLVRNVMGADPNSGAIAIGDFVRAGQTVQFHVRDARTADEDLRELLTASRGSATAAAAAALLFTCNGRGTRLFPEPNHDAACLRDCLGEIPVAGFFAQGELGPIAGSNFLHGFTASVAIFEPVEAGR